MVLYFSAEKSENKFKVKKQIKLNLFSVFSYNQFII